MFILELEKDTLTFENKYNNCMGVKHKERVFCLVLRSYKLQ